MYLIFCVFRHIENLKFQIDMFIYLIEIIYIVKLNNISKEEFIKYIDNGYFMSDIAKNYNVGKDTIRRTFEKLNILDYYYKTPKQTMKTVKFRFHNQELKKRLELFGPLYNVVD